VGDLRTEQEVRFLAGYGVYVGGVQRFHVQESCHVQRPDVVVRSIGIVGAKLTTGEASRIDSGVASAYLDASVEKRTQCLD